MAWNYDATLLSEDTSVGRLYIIRLITGDTDTDDQQLQDEEIYWYLTRHGDSIRYAAMDAVRGLIAKYSRDVDMWMGHTRVGAAGRQRNYRMLLDYLENDMTTALVEILVGGQSWSEKEAIHEDTDVVQPSFIIGMDDING